MIPPPFKINLKILDLVAQIQELIGELRAQTVARPSVKLRKENKIRTIHSSLAIEGNTLTEEQITAILENQRVVGPRAQITEVQNALRVYNEISKFDPLKENDFLKAHKELLRDLIRQPGKYRSTQVGVFKGSKVSHMAPPARQIPTLMRDLFQFLNKDKATPWLIKACVFHYELEFIHPFEDGNGRMGRFWQQLLLMKQSSVFEYIATETLIHKRQKDYYRALELCDKAGDSTLFIEFSLELILKCLKQFTGEFRPTKAKINDRIQFGLSHFGKKTFSRKDYMNLHKDISAATASRDLALAVKQKILIKSGDKARALYERAPFLG